MHPHACAPLVHLGKCAEDTCRYTCMREMFAYCNSVGPDLLSPSVPNPRGLPSITGEAASDTCPLPWAAVTPCSPSACPQPPPPGAALQSSGHPPGARCGAVGAEGRPCWQRGRAGPGVGAVPSCGAEPGPGPGAEPCPEPCPRRLRGRPGPARPGGEGGREGRRRGDFQAPAARRFLSLFCFRSGPARRPGGGGGGGGGRHF